MGEFWDKGWLVNLQLKGNKFGSGILFNDQGFVLTAFHNVYGNTAGEHIIEKATTSLDGNWHREIHHISGKNNITVQCSDPQLARKIDLIAIKAEGTSFTRSPLQISTELPKEKDSVILLYYDLNNTKGNYWREESAIVGPLFYQDGFCFFPLHKINGISGASGGGVFTQDGKLLGIIQQKRDDTLDYVAIFLADTKLQSLIPQISNSNSNFNNSSTSEQHIPSITFDSPKIIDIGVNELKALIPRVEILLLTVNDWERKALLSEMTPIDGRDGILQGALDKLTYRIGMFGNYCAAYTESTMSSGGRHGATLTAERAINELKPKAVLLLGIAFGIDSSKQKLGDVLIAESIQPYEFQKVHNDFSITYRGQATPCGYTLSERFRMRRDDWTPKHGDKSFNDVKVHQGLVLSGEKLVNNKDFRDALVKAFPTAIGGEMEGAGAYSAVSSPVEVILIKSICDWADGDKNDNAQPFAAFTAISLAKHILSKPDSLFPLIPTTNKTYLLSSANLCTIKTSKLEEVKLLNTRIRENEETLLKLTEMATKAGTISSIFSWIQQVKKEIANLKGQVNLLIPETYAEKDISQPTNFHNQPHHSFFVGREETISEILEHLDYKDKTWVVSIDGLGGIGKTSLAREIAYRCNYAKTFEDIIWITTQQRFLSPTTLTEMDSSLVEFDDVLNFICNAFGQLTAKDFSLENKFNTVNKLMENRRCLLVLDNVETMNNTKKIEYFLRKTPHLTKTIVTSRRTISGPVTGEKLIRLNPLMESESLLLIEHLQKNKAIDLSEEQQTTLFQLCSGIPIAIEWSIGRMSLLSVRVVLDDLRTHTNMDNLTNYCFNSSVKSLLEYSKETVDLFSMLSIFPFSLPEDSIQEMFSTFQGKRLEESLHELDLSSLITWNKNNKTVSTLPIIRQYASKELSPSTELAQKARNCFAQYCSTKQPNNLHVFSPSNELIILPHGSSPVDFAYKIHTSLGNKFLEAKVNGIKVEPSYRLKNGDVVNILTSPSSQGPKIEWAITNRAKRSIQNRHKHIVFIRRGNSLSKRGILETALNEYNLAVARDNTNIWAYNRRGHVLRLLGNTFSAFKEYQQVLSLSPDNPFAYCGIATIKYQQRMFYEAYENHNKALKLKKDYINSLVGLGKTLCHLKAYKEAEEILINALHVSKQIKQEIKDWILLYLSISQINQGEQRFSDSVDNLTLALKGFSKKTSKAIKGITCLGSHVYYYYTISLVLANSSEWKYHLEKAMKFCNATGLIQEIMVDIETINTNCWEQWGYYIKERYSKPFYTNARSNILYLLKKYGGIAQ